MKDMSILRPDSFENLKTVTRSETQKKKMPKTKSIWVLKHLNDEKLSNFVPKMEPTYGLRGKAEQSKGEAIDAKNDELSQMQKILLRIVFRLRGETEEK